MKKILLITGDAGESYETLYAMHRFAEAGYQPVIAAPSVKRLNLVMHDFEPGWDTYKESPGYKVMSDISITEVEPDDYVAIMVLGGRAPEYLRHDQHLLHLVQSFDRLQKPIWSLCHGIQVLIAAGITSGRQLTCYENVRFELEAVGGIFCEVEAVRHGHIISGQTWQSHPEFYREVFTHLDELPS